MYRTHVSNSCIDRELVEGEDRWLGRLEPGIQRGSLLV